MWTGLNFEKNEVTFHFTVQMIWDLPSFPHFLFKLEQKLKESESKSSDALIWIQGV